MSRGRTPLPRGVLTIFVDHDPDREVRHLAWRVRIFGAGAILALVGMYFRAGWMVTLAIGVLLIGFLLRFLPEFGEDGDADGNAEDHEPGTG